MHRTAETEGEPKLEQNLPWQFGWINTPSEGGREVRGVGKWNCAKISWKLWVTPRKEGNCRRAADSIVNYWQRCADWTREPRPPAHRISIPTRSADQWEAPTLGERARSPPTTWLSAAPSVYFMRAYWCAAPATDFCSRRIRWLCYIALRLAFASSPSSCEKLLVRPSGRGADHAVKQTIDFFVHIFGVSDYKKRRWQYIKCKKIARLIVDQWSQPRQRFPIVHSVFRLVRLGESVWMQVVICKRCDESFFWFADRFVCQPPSPHPTVGDRLLSEKISGGDRFFGVWYCRLTILVRPAIWIVEEIL